MYRVQTDAHRDRQKIGVNTSTAGVMSMKIPTTSRIKLIVSRMINGLSEIPSNASLTTCGTCSAVSKPLIAWLTATSSITIPVVRADPIMIRGNALMVTSR
jgi:hypothetical protein